jgi:hypothetical protein
MSDIHAVAKLPEINAYIKEKHGTRRALTPAETSILFEEGNAQMRVIRRNWPVRTGTSRAAWRLSVRGRPGDVALIFDNPMYYSSWVTRKGQTPVRDGGRPWYQVLIPKVFKTGRPRLIRRLKEAIDRTELELQQRQAAGQTPLGALQTAGQVVPPWQRPATATTQATSFQRLLRRLT